VSIVLAEKGSTAMLKKLRGFDRLVSANLLYAELMSVLRREKLPPTPGLLAVIGWIIPNRPLNDEIAQVLNAGYVRGADCLHLATALYLAPNPADVSFLTLDARQREIAGSLGFRQ